MRIGRIFLLLLIVLVAPVQADEDFQWQISPGLAVWDEKSLLAGAKGNDAYPVIVTLQIDLKYRNFFLETVRRRVTGLFDSALVGYRIYADEVWQTDVVLSSHMNRISESGYSYHGDTIVPELKGIRTRGSDSSLGLRVQHFRGPHHLSLELGNDISQRYSSYLFQGYYSYLAQLRNWDLQLTAGLHLYSGELVDYYFGILPTEATARRPVYHGRSAHMLHLGLSALYPLNEHWLLDLGMGLNRYSSSIANSPIVASNVEALGMVSIRYVF
ncbi:MipA/OmpV family protein [Bowmanella dokdonensis]|uniref:MipA/OmpV family protein n=1 Tax=Bowmanella dokdonensis TaxID=751969 RepID=A0A939DMB4_9ALTE|nr:MipA/OmpV family protein [Bowmanella dokdonensis]MBN7825394.1 MipA/OmpV family protein [Bowmanella dokdonensis]